MTARLQNWAGNVTFNAQRVHRPTSVADVQRLVAASPRVHALGAGHSFSPVADTRGDLVSLAALPGAVEVDRERQRVSVSGGTRYGELAVALERAGLALPNLASLPHLSVVGACATGTHGSGSALGGLAESVVSVDLVAATGDLLTVTRDDDPGWFQGSVVALGALGVVVRLTLAVVPSFRLRQHVYEGLPRAALDADLEGLFRSGYSVSLFTDWRGRDFVQAWVKRLDDGTAEPAPPLWRGAHRADAPRHPVPGMAAVHCTEQGGRPGAWHERLPHFRLDFTPSSGEELQSEYLVPRTRGVEAVHALDDVAAQIAAVLQIGELRTVATDEAWLSPSAGRESLAIHFTWVKDEAAVAPVVAAVEDRLAAFDARPHWGKVFAMEPERVRAVYPRAEDFQRLRAWFDPTGVFGNDFVDHYLPAAG